MAGLLAVATSKRVEISQSVGTDDFTLVLGGKDPVGPFRHEYVEVVEPEIGHHFLKLAFTVDGAQNLGLLQLHGYLADSF